jgi:hypothetical protein
MGFQGIRWDYMEKLGFLRFFLGRRWLGSSDVLTIAPCG